MAASKLPLSEDQVFVTNKRILTNCEALKSHITSSSAHNRAHIRDVLYWIEKDLLLVHRQMCASVSNRADDEAFVSAHIASRVQAKEVSAVLRRLTNRFCQKYCGDECVRRLCRSIDSITRYDDFRMQTHYQPTMTSTKLGLQGMAVPQKRQELEEGSRLDDARIQLVEAQTKAMHPNRSNLYSEDLGLQNEKQQPKRDFERNEAMKQQVAQEQASRNRNARQLEEYSGSSAKLGASQGTRSAHHTDIDEKNSRAVAIARSPPTGDVSTGYSSVEELYECLDFDELLRYADEPRIIGCSLQVKQGQHQLQVNIGVSDRSSFTDEDSIKLCAKLAEEFFHDELGCICEAHADRPDVWWASRQRMCLL